MKRFLNIFIALVAFAVIVPSYTANAAQRSTKKVVKTGIDVLESNGFKQLQGKKIGLVTNPSGVNNKLVSTVDILANAPGVELDSTRKYNLYREFMSLYNACDNYISKLENILRNDYDENQIILISVNNLREIKDIVSDYMTIRFQINTYVQSLLFYQKMIVAVQLVFKLLKSINSKKN